MGAQQQSQARVETKAAPIPPAEIKVVGANLEDARLPKSQTLAVLATEGNLANVVGQDKSPEYSNRFAQAAKQTELVSSHAHYLRNEDIASYGKALTSCIDQVNKAIAAKDEQALNTALSKLEKKLEILEKFINYEKTQGLVGVHGETGVRIYVRGDKLYLCTPDNKAFKDVLKNPDDAEQLKAFVANVDGISLIKHAKSQISEERDGVKLLSCRVDSLTKEEGKAEYKLKTKVRNADGEFKWTEFSFTPKQLAERGMQGVAGFNDSSKLPEVHIKTSDGAGHDANYNVGSASGNLGTQATFRPQSAAELSAYSRAVQSGVRPVTQLAQRSTEYVTRGISNSRQISALRTIVDGQRQVSNVDLSAIDTAEKAAQKLTELDNNSATYQKAIERRVDSLKRQLEKIPESERATNGRAKKYTAQISNLEESAAKEILTRKSLLEKQLELADDAGKLAAKKALVQMKDDILKAYDRYSTSAKPEAKQIASEGKPKFESELKVYEAEVPVVQTKPGIVTRAKNAAADAKASASAWVEKHPRVKSVVDTVTKKREIPFLPSQEKKANASYESSTKTLAETPANSKEVAKALKSLESDGATIKARLDTLEKSQAKGVAGLDAEISKLQERNADILIRRKELMQKQIAELGDANAAARAKVKLYGEMGEGVESAYRQKGQNAEADQFASERKEYKSQQDQAVKLKANPELAKANAAVREAEKALAEAADGSPLKVEKQAALDLAKSQEKITAQRLEIKDLEEKLLYDPENAKLKAQAAEKQKILNESLLEEKNLKITHVEAKKVRMSAELAEIDTKLADSASSLDDAAKKNLEVERTKLKADQAKLETELSSLKDTATLESYSKLEAEIAQKEKALAAEKDAGKQGTIKQEISDLKIKAAEQKSQFYQADADSRVAKNTLLQKAVDDIDAQVKTLPKGHPGIKELGKVKDSLLRDIEGNKLAIEYSSGEVKIAQGEIKIKKTELSLAEKKSELSALPKDVDPATKANLEKTIKGLEDELNLAVKDLSAFQKEFNGKFNGIFKRLKENWVKNYETFKAGNQYKNPVLAAAVMGTAVESYRGIMMADYSENGKHPFLVPSLLHFFNKDLEDWQYRTNEVGVSGAVALHVTDALGNTVLVTSTVVAGHKLGGLTLKGANYVIGKSTGFYVAETAAAKTSAAFLGKLAGKPLAFGGAAVDGFFSYSDGSFVDDNGLQSFGRSSSPIVAGAAFGSFFGPIGAGVGAASGAVGEGIGMAYYVNIGQPAEISENWKRRSVRESIDRASRGYIYDESDPIVKSRPLLFDSLREEERAEITKLAKGELMKELFTFKPSDKAKTQEQLDQEVAQWKKNLTDAGFRLFGDNPTQAQINDIGAYNYARMESLVEGRWGVNPVYWVYGNQIDEVKKVNHEFATQFENIYLTKRKEMQELYTRSIRVYFNSDSVDDRVLSTNTFDVLTAEQLKNIPKSEFETLMRAVTNEFAVKFKSRHEAVATEQQKSVLADEQWQYLLEKMPGLDRIFASKDDREAFIKNFDTYLPAGMPKFHENALWQNWRASETGSKIVIGAGMVEEVAKPITDSISDLEIPGS